MIRTIARKEYLELVRDGRFRLAALIVAGLLSAALLLGALRFSQMRTAREEALGAERAVWLAQGDRNPHSAAHFGQYAFKPSEPVSLVDPGLNTYTGAAVWMEAHYQNPFKFRPAEDGTGLLRFGELTAAATLQLLVPLLIILLAFGTFSGEKEQGTLRQLASLGVPSRTLALGKAAGIGRALALLLVPAALIGAAALALATGAGSALSQSAGRFALLALGYLLYFGIFLALTLAVSAASSSSRLALVGLFAFWIVNGLLVPRAAASLAAQIHPTPAPTDFWTAVREDMSQGIDGHNDQDARRAELERSTLEKYGVESLEKLPVNFDGIALQAGEEYGNRIFDGHYAALWDTFSRQNSVQLAGGVVAPLQAVRPLSMGAAGTDFEAHRHFAAAAERHRRVINRMLNADMTENAGKEGFDYRASAALWRQIPAFDYDAPALGWVLAQQTRSLVILSVWFVAASLLALAAVRRVRVV